MPRHPSFLLKIFYISLSPPPLSPSISLPLSLPLSPSISPPLFLSLFFSFSLSLSLTCEEGVRERKREREREKEKEKEGEREKEGGREGERERGRERERELRACWISKHAHTLSVPHSVSQSVCDYYINAGSVTTNGREPRSCLGRVFSSKLGWIATLGSKCMVCMQPLLKLKTLPKACPVS